MLIDTNSIVQKTELRLKLSSILERVAEGEVIYISDRGEIEAKLTPVANTASGKKNADKILKEIEQLAIKFEKKGFGKWNSLEVIHTSRTARTKHLLSLMKK